MAEDTADEDPYRTEYTQPGQGAADATSIFIPAGITSISPAFFQLFPNLKSVTVADDNETYSSYNGILFDAERARLLLVPEGMEGNAVLPQSVASVPAYAFSRCTKLTAIALEGSTANHAFAIQDGILYSADRAQLIAAPAGIGATAAIAADCQQIAEGALYGNHDLKTIVAPGSVASIEEDAFARSAVEGATVTITAQGDAYDAARAVWEAAGFTRFAEAAEPGQTIEPAEGSGFAFTLLPDYTLAVRWAGEDAAPAKLEVPDYGIIGDVRYKVSAVAEEGFAGQDGIQQVMLPEGLTALGASAFAGAAELNTIDIPGSVAAIGDSAFAGCEKLVAITLHEGLRTIGDAAFQGIAQKAVVLPASVKAVGDYAFANSPNLAMVVALGTVAEVGPNALAGAQGLKLYVPYDSDESYVWTAGLPAAGNHLMPYGVKLADKTIDVNVGEEADLFAEGYLHAPGDFKVSYAYKARPISISDEGKVEGKEDGTSNVEVALTLDVPRQVVTGITSKDARLTPAAYTPGAEPTLQTADVVESTQPVTVSAVATVASTDLGTRASSSDGYRVYFSAEPDDAFTVGLAESGNPTVSSSSFIFDHVKSLQFTGTTVKVINDGSGPVGYNMETISGIYFQLYIPSGTGDYWWDEANLCWKASTAKTLTLTGSKSFYHGVPNAAGKIQICGYEQTEIKLEVGSSASGEYLAAGKGFACRVNRLTVRSDSGKPILEFNGLSDTHGSNDFRIQTYFDRNNRQNLLPDAFRIKGTDKVLGFGTHLVSYNMELEPVFNEDKRYFLPEAYEDNTVTVRSDAFTMGWSTGSAITSGSNTGLSTTGTIPVGGEGKSFYYVSQYEVSPAGIITLTGKIANLSTLPVCKITITPNTSLSFAWEFEGGSNSSQIADGAYAPNGSATTLVLKKKNSWSSITEGMPFYLNVPAGSLSGSFTWSASDGTSGTVKAGSHKSFVASKIEVRSDGSLSFTGWDGSTLVAPKNFYISSSASNFLGFGEGNTIETATLENVLRKGGVYVPAYGGHFYMQYSQTTINFNLNGKSATNGSTCTTKKIGAAGSTETIIAPKTGGYTYNYYSTTTNGTGNKYFTDRGTPSTSYAFQMVWNCTLPEVTLYAQYMVNSLTVTFDGNGNTGGSTTSPQTITTNGSVRTLNANGFTRTGYAFQGWATSKAGSKTYDDQHDMTTFMENTAAFKNSFTLYAVWSANRVVITFDGNSNTSGTMDEQTILYTDKTKTLAANAFVRDYYTFKGWSSTAGGSVVAMDQATVTVPDDTYSTDLSYYASWSSNYLTVTFDANGGSGSMSGQTIKYTDKTKTLASNAFTRTNYSFAGWATSAAGSVAYTNGADVGSSISASKEETELKLFAKWTLDTATYKVNHYLQNASDDEYYLSSTDTSAAVAIGTSVNPIDVTKEHAGFTYVPTLGTTEAQTVAANGSTTFNIYYKRNTYPLKYSYSGIPSSEAQPPAETQVKYGATTALPIPEEVAGYTFLYWQNKGSGTTYNPGDEFGMPRSGVEFIGVWRAEKVDVAIIFHLQNADNDQYVAQDPKIQQRTAGSTVNPSSFNNTYFVRNTTMGDTAPVTVKGDGSTVINIYFDRGMYKLTCEYSGEVPASAPALPAEARYRYDQTVPFPVIPEIPNYTFLGWSINGSSDLTSALTFKMPGVSTTVTGVWECNNKYTLTFDGGADDAEGTAPTGGLYNPDDIITLPVNDPAGGSGFTRSSYVFLGWSHVRGAAVPEFMAGQQLTLGHLAQGNALTLYAVWGPQVNVTSPIAPSVKLMVKPSSAGATSGNLSESVAANANIFTSQTPEDVLISSMQCAPIAGENGTGKVFLRKELWQFVNVVLDGGGAAKATMPINADASKLTFTMGDDGKFIIPASGQLPLDVDLEVPDYVQIAIVDDEVDVARLMFTFQLAKEPQQA